MEDQATYQVVFGLVGSSQIVRSEPMTKSEAESTYRMISADIVVGHYTNIYVPSFDMDGKPMMSPRSIAWVDIVETCNTI